MSGNQPHPAARTLPFSSVDPRVVYTVNRVDPRVHFALVCGAKVSAEQDIDRQRIVYHYMCNVNVFHLYLCFL